MPGAYKDLLTRIEDFSVHSSKDSKPTEQEVHNLAKDQRKGLIYMQGNGNEGNSM